MEPTNKTSGDSDLQAIFDHTETNVELAEGSDATQEFLAHDPFSAQAADPYAAIPVDYDLDDEKTDPWGDEPNFHKEDMSEDDRWNLDEPTMPMLTDERTWWI